VANDLYAQPVEYAMYEPPVACPFCGALALTLVHEDTLYDGFKSHVLCLLCDATGPLALGGAEAVRLWNQRTPPRQKEQEE
jgi:Lar family restriction alleviation protein